MNITVYLDWNVMQEVIDGRLPAAASIMNRLRAVGIIRVPFTREHVIEAARTLDMAEPFDRQRLDTLLHGISDLTDDTFLYRTSDGMSFASKTPFEVNEEVGVMTLDVDFPGLDLMVDAVRVVLRQLLVKYESNGIDVGHLFERVDGLQSIIQVAELFQEISLCSTRSLEKYGFNPNKMNNVSPERLPAEVDAILKKEGARVDFAGIKSYCADNVEGWVENPVPGMVGLLSAVGYHRDAPSVTAASQFSDYVHADLGLRATVFATDDRRFRERARAVAGLEGLHVKIVTPSELVRLLEAIEASSI